MSEHSEECLAYAADAVWNNKMVSDSATFTDCRELAAKLLAEGGDVLVCRCEGASR